jgi:hypothetical protein
MKVLKFLIYITFLLPVQFVSGQYYDTGQDPAFLKWMQIKTGRFTIIYPKSYGDEGIKYARSLEDAYSKLVSIYSEKKFSIPVIIHSLTTNSNGYVAWAPHRMELYPTPEQNTIPLATEEQLAVHELTHVFQMESLSAGFSKVMSFILGEQFTGLTASMIPLWFLEGDAVFAESALTLSGRGRTPAFQKQLKAIALEERGMYNYDKIINGSFRNFVPDYYQSGFQMVTWSVAKYDPQLWKKVLSFTAREPFTINPVNISLRRNANLTKRKLFEETFDSLKTIWRKDITDIDAKPYTALNPSAEGKYINYYSPVIAGKDSIIAIKTSLDNIDEFVLVYTATRTEKKIHIPGPMYPYFLSFANKKITWVETQYDPRWDNRDYSVIKVLDITTNKFSNISHRSRYMAAALSPDGLIIAASENTISNRNNLVLLDAGNGNIVFSVESPGNSYLQHPQWSDRGDKITFINLTDAGEGIISYTMTSKKWDTLVEPGRDDLQSASLRNDSLFFISSLSGTDNVYLKTIDNKIKALTNSEFGVSDLSVAGRSVVFSDYTFLGNTICITPIGSSEGSINAKITDSSFLINRIKITSNENKSNFKTDYTPVPFRKWQHLLKFHSWMPFYADIARLKADPAAVRPGVTIMSQNILSTLITEVGYEYTVNKEHVFHSGITWKGWYPVIESQIDYGYNAQIYKTSDIGNPSTIRTGFSFKNTAYVPLRFVTGVFVQYLMPSFSSEYRNDYIYIKTAGTDGTYDFGQTILSPRLYMSNYYRSTNRDIYPRWAQVIDLYYSYAPFDRSIYGTSATLKTAFYFPGILPSNGIRIRYEKEKQILEKFRFGNRVSLPRGYNNIFVKEIDFLSVDYVLPVVYPDFNLSSFLYLKRIRAGFFYDYASGPGNAIFNFTGNSLTPFTQSSARESLKSGGIELLADFHLFRIPYLISGGLQTAWKSVNQRPSFELLFNIDLYGFMIGKRGI